jgi:hypothetical protein
MSVVKKVCSFSFGLKNFLSSPLLKNSVIFAFVYFLFLGVFLNVYAAEYEGYDPLKTFPEIREFKESGSVVGNHSYLSAGNDNANVIFTLLDLVNPGAHAHFDKIAANPNISNSAKLGFLGIADTATTALLYSPPQTDVVEHLAQEWIPNYQESQNALYAASGTEQLKSLKLNEIWNVTRNLAYILFVIVFVIAGFMIMFRHKLGGQVMVSVYNTLPGIIVGLVLVTFSFAIVGLMMDLGVFLQRVIEGVLDLNNKYMNPSNPFSIYWRFTADGFWMDLTSGSIDMSFKGIFARALESFAIINPVGALINIFTGNSTQDLFILLIASFIVLFAAVKIFITLLKAYVGIILQTIIGPLVIAVSTIPGRQGLLGDWFKVVIKHVLTFVLVFLIVHIPIYLMLRVDINAWDMFSVGLGKDRSGLAEGANMFGLSKFIYASVAIYCFFLAANVPKMLDEFLPLTRGKGPNLAAEGVKKEFAKIPGLGGFAK